ncbi:MAG: PKD domain-containing protein, partial [Bacteroidia bacterium]|nr:PKD domain-containing protein [Bacteroidia bacterium]
TYTGPTLNSSGLMPSCWPPTPPPTGDVNHDLWFKFTVGKSGSLVWRATPLGPTEFDWALYDITGGCPGVELACNYAFGGAFNPFGMDSSSIGCLFSQYCPPINVVAGNTYAIMIDDFSGMGSAAGFDFEWGGTFGMLPTTEFTVDNPVGCGSLSTTFTDSSGVSPFAVYNWDFGNGTTSSVKNPGLQTYSTPGNYIVTLSITDTTGCTSFAAQEINVSNYVPGALTGDTIICVGSNDTITYAAGPNDSLFWDWGTANVISGSGAGPYVIQWPITGFQVVTLYVTDTANNCSAVLMHDLLVISGVNSGVTMVSNGCSGDTITVTYSGQPADTVIWNFGSANIISGSGIGPYTISWPGPTIDTVRALASIANCAASIAIAPIVISNVPTANFTLQASACANENVQIIYSGSGAIGATYNWNFNGGIIVAGSGQGPYTISWASSGAKFVTLSVTENSCTSTIYLDSITVNEVPTSTFVSDTAILCGNQAATVTYTGNATPTAMYTWNFDGAIIVSGAGQGPYQLTWPTAGVKTITLYVFENGCYSDTTAVTINVGIQPLADAGLDNNVCTNDSIQLGTPAVPGYLYTWDPITALDNASAAQPYLNYSTVPSSPFTQIYILTVQSGFCFDVDSVEIIVTETPTSLFTIDTALICDNDPVNISYTGNASNAANYNWNFNGAIINSGTGQGPYNINWVNTGVKNVSLWVEENGCFSDTTSFTIDVANTPTANAGSDQTFCSNDTITIGTAALAGLNYQWTPSFGLSNDTLADPELSLININATDQMSTYLLTVSDKHCSDTNSVTVTVKAVQVAEINGPAGQCINGNSFDFFAGGVSVPGASFDWNFGANATPANSAMQNPSNIVFNSIGPQLITLTTSTPGCQMNVDTQSVFIYPMPEPGFISDKDVGCPPMAVQFTDTSITSPNSTYQWNFGGLGTSTQMDPRFVFNESGFHDVTMTVTSNQGCSSTITLADRIEILARPQGMLFADPTDPFIIDPVVNFEYSSSDPVSCFYKFGDGASSTDCEPDHKYDEIGSYIVQLIVTNNLGCSDTLYELINVQPFYSLYVPSAFSPNNDNRNDLFVAQGYGVVEFKIEIFNRWGQLQFTSDNMLEGWNGKYNNDAAPVPAGVYVYKIFARDDQGKKHNKIGTVTLVR